MRWRRCVDTDPRRPPKCVCGVGIGNSNVDFPLSRPK